MERVQPSRGTRWSEANESAESERDKWRTRATFAIGINRTRCEEETHNTHTAASKGKWRNGGKNEENGMFLAVSISLIQPLQHSGALNKPHAYNRITFDLSSHFVLVFFSRILVLP